MHTAITCTRRIEFDAGHRIVEHESKCRYLHGHRYVVEASFTAPKLDELGRIIDFGVIKEKLGGWIDAHWDHTTILFDKDRALGNSIASHTGQIIYYLPVNPTAENMADYLLTHVCPELFAGQPLQCVRIVLHETPNCHVEAIASKLAAA
jgi:6-pyruvoyltetrahydropterin/6-carboxytetrahydropterin synthase